MENMDTIEEIMKSWADAQSAIDLKVMNFLNELNAYAVMHDGKLPKEAEDAGAWTRENCTAWTLSVNSQPVMDNGTEKWYHLSVHSDGQVSVYLERRKPGYHGSKQVFHVARNILRWDKTLAEVVKCVRECEEDPLRTARAISSLTPELERAIDKVLKILRSRPKAA